MAVATSQSTTESIFTIRTWSSTTQGFGSHFVFTTKTLKHWFWNCIEVRFHWVSCIVFEFLSQSTDYTHSGSEYFHWDTWRCLLDEWKLTALSVDERLSGSTSFLHVPSFYFPYRRWASVSCSFSTIAKKQSAQNNVNV